MWFSKYLFFICLKLCFHVSRFLQEKKDPNRGASGFNITSWNCTIQGTETSWPWTHLSGERLERPFWNVKVIVDLPGSLNRPFQWKITKISKLLTLDLSQDTIIIMGFIPAQRPGQKNLPNVGCTIFSSPLYWRDLQSSRLSSDVNEYASSVSSSLKKRPGNMKYVWKIVIARLHLASFQASSANCGGSIVDGRNGNVDANNASLLYALCRPIIKFLNLHEFAETKKQLAVFLLQSWKFLEGIESFNRNLIIPTPELCTWDSSRASPPASRQVWRAWKALVHWKISTLGCMEPCNR